MGDAVLTIVVPPALTRAFAEEVAARLADLPGACRVVRFVGSTPEIFSLGMDLEGFLRAGDDPSPAVGSIGDALVAIHQCDRPTLGIAQGQVAGGGVGLLAACDLVIASDDATFGLPELLWGFVPAAIWPMITARLGERRARSWAVTAHSRGAAEALAGGLVDEVVPAADLDRAARRAARSLARIDPSAVGLLRSWSAEAPTLPVEAAIRKGARLSATQLNDPRVRARLQAYFLDGSLPWEAS